MKVGLTVPQTQPDPRPVFDVVSRAEGAGIDGAFVFDHLWPFGQPGRPILSSYPLLGALVSATSEIHLGPLVARVGLVPDAVLVHTLASLARMAGPRFIAALGTGDKLSHQENEAFGVPPEAAGHRYDSLSRCADDLRNQGVTTWVGGTSKGVKQVAAEHADALNLWGVDGERVAADRADLSPRRVEVTWGGIVRAGTDVRGLLEEVAGATWFIASPTDDVDVDDLIGTLAAWKGQGTSEGLH
jgi:alkanesulfonate monooxygenase SsuD/methylene tetrahydromethanopterin reductase-like flavin-dependent oxidoreductase (luciferase family)